jgi:hypothetical protein
MDTRNLWADAFNFMRRWFEAREDALLIDDAERDGWTKDLRNYVQSIAYGRLVRGENPATRQIWMKPDDRAYYRAKGRSLRLATEWREKNPGRFTGDARGAKPIGALVGRKAVEGMRDGK